MTDRTKLRRRSQRGSHDRSVIEAILDEALVCHVACTTPHCTIVLPTAHVRVNDRLFIHGATANGLLRALADGADACVAVTLLDALVLAKSAFHHSVNYRSVVLFGRGEVITDDATKRRALDALLDKMAPERSTRCRPPTEAELGATLVIAFPIDEASAKIRTGPPIDDAEDQALPHWAGLIPLVTTRGAPVDA